MNQTNKIVSLLISLTIENLYHRNHSQTRASKTRELDDTYIQVVEKEKQKEKGNKKVGE